MAPPAGFRLSPALCYRYSVCGTRRLTVPPTLRETVSNFILCRRCDSADIIREGRM